MVDISSFLSEAGHLQLTNAVLTALPTFLMFTFLLPITVIKQIDKFRKHCLWRGSNLNSKKTPKAAWDLVCDSKKNGGLGVIKLQTQNESLLLKHFHKFFNKLDVPWVNLIGISIMEMVSSIFSLENAPFGREISSNCWTPTKA